MHYDTKEGPFLGHRTSRGRQTINNHERLHKLAKRLQDDRRKKVSPQRRKVLELHRPHTHTHTQVHTQSQAAGPGTHSMPTYPAQGSPSSSFLGLPCYNMQPLETQMPPCKAPLRGPVKMVKGKYYRLMPVCP